MSAHHENRSPFAFLILTFIYSWIVWLPGVLAGLGVDLGFDAEKYGMVLTVIGAFGPMAAAVTLIVRRHGWKESWRFIRQLFDFKAKPVYFVLALAVPLVITAVSHYCAPLFNLEVAGTLLPEDSGVTPWLLAIPYFFMILVAGGGQEEIGWRGYAQQPLQKRFGVIPASLMIGVCWGLWHLPLWIMPGDAHSTYSFFGFLIMTSSTSVVLAWLYNTSRQKIVIPWIFHAMSNTAAPLFPFLHGVEGKEETAYWLYVAVNVIAAIIAIFFIQKQKGIRE